jgi:hypothetical protein
MIRNEQQPITVVFIDGDGELIVSDRLGGPTPKRTEHALRAGTFQPKEFDPDLYQSELKRYREVTLFVRTVRLAEKLLHKGRHVVNDGPRAINVFRHEAKVARASLLTGRGMHLRKTTISQLEEGRVAVGNNDVYRYSSRRDSPLARLDSSIFNHPRISSSLHKAGTIFTRVRNSSVPIRRVFMVENDLAAALTVASVPKVLGMDPSIVTVFLTEEYGVPGVKDLMGENGIPKPPNVIFVWDIKEAANCAIMMAPLISLAHRDLM